MKYKFSRVFTLALISSYVGLWSFPVQAAESCDDVAKDVKRRVESDASRVLIVVEDSMIKNEKCACEIIKAAITSSNADALLVKQIVFTAVAAAPGMSSSISECAMAVKPDAAAEIAEGLQSALGMGIVKENGDTSGKSGYNLSGKSGYDFSKNPKNPIISPPAEPPVDFGNSPVDIRGIYLIQPVSAAPFIKENDDQCGCDDRSIACKEVKRLGKLLAATNDLNLSGNRFEEVRDALSVVDFDKITNEDLLKLRNTLRSLDKDDLNGNATLTKLRNLLNRFENSDLTNSAWKKYLECFKEGYPNPVSPSVAATTSVAIRSTSGVAAGTAAHNHAR